jgi:hypothetical protein
MAPRRANAALFAQDSLSDAEQKMMDDDRANTEPVERNPLPASPPPAPEPTPSATPTPQPEPQATPEAGATPAAASETPAAASPPAAPLTPEQQVAENHKKALDDERERRKVERLRAEKAEQELARLSGRFSTLEELARAASAQDQQRQQAQQQQFQIPNVDTDPVGHFQAQNYIRDQRQAQVEQWAMQQAQIQQQQQAINTARTYALMSEQEFAKGTPDYPDAANFVQAQRSKQLEILGFRDPAQRQQQLALEALNLAETARQRGENPAKQIYDWAVASGWQPPVKNGAASPPPAPTAAAAQKLQTVAAGQHANTSLSQMPGQSARSGKPSMEALLRMSDADFDKALQGKSWKELWE